MVFSKHIINKGNISKVNTWSCFLFRALAANNFFFFLVHTYCTFIQNSFKDYSPLPYKKYALNKLVAHFMLFYVQWIIKIWANNGFPLFYNLHWLQRGREWVHPWRKHNIEWRISPAIGFTNMPYNMFATSHCHTKLAESPQDWAVSLTLLFYSAPWAKIQNYLSPKGSFSWY